MARWNPFGDIDGEDAQRDYSDAMRELFEEAARRGITKIDLAPPDNRNLLPAIDGWTCRIPDSVGR